MRFIDIIGQHKIKDFFKEMTKSGRISHAIMLHGRPGTGKLSLAIAFAQYLSCTNRTEHDSCGMCPSCIKYEKLVHPDLHFVFPVINTKEKKSISDSYITEWREKVLADPYFSLNEWLEDIGAEKKQGSIFADESAEIIKKLNLKTFESEYKCMIIWLPERMNISCANKLLKILEEPPENTVFILVSDNREEILPTVLSRTQPVLVGGIEDYDLIRALKQKFGEDSLGLEEICKLSQGSFLAAKNHINTSEETKYNFSKFAEIMRNTYARKINESLSWASEIAAIGREKQKSFINYSLRFLRENFILSYNKQEIQYLLELEKDFAAKFSAFITENNIYSLVEEFEKAHYHVERNANPKILFTDLVFKIMKVIR